MAFTLDNILSDGDIEVVLKMDNALDMTEDEYESYLSDLDESKLKLKDGGEPTRFVMKKHISLKHTTKIENSKMSYTEGGDVSVGLAFTIEEVRASLKEIKYGPSTPKEKQIVLKFTGDKLVDESQMAAFVSAGIVTNLYNARANFLKNQASGGSVKKS